MPMKGQERGMRNPFVLRAGITLPRVRGTNTQGDASSIGDDEFRALENVQHDGVKWNSRDGLAKVNSGAAMTGSIYGIWDESGDGGGGGGSGLGLGGPVRLYGGVNNNAANLIYAYDSGLTTVGQQIKVNPGESSFGAMIALHDEFVQLLPTPLQEATEGTDADNEARILLGGTNGKVYMWRPAFVPEGKTLLDVAPTPRLLFQCPGLSASDDITSFVFVDGLLFVASDAGSDVKVFSFDGSTVTLEDTISTMDTGILGAWQGQVYCATNAQSIRQRDWAGAWTSLTFPGTVTAFIPRQILEYGLNLYFAGQDGSGGTGEILKWDGSSLTVARSIAGDTKILALEVFDDTLTYLYAGPSPHTFYGAADGAAFLGATPPAVRELFSPYLTFHPALVDSSLMYGSNLPVNVAGTWTITLYTTPALLPGATFNPTALGTIAVAGASATVLCGIVDGSEVLFYVNDPTPGTTLGSFFSWDGATLAADGDTSAATGTVRMRQIAPTFSSLLCSLSGSIYCVVPNRVTSPAANYMTIFKRDAGGGSWSVVVEYTDADIAALGGWTPDVTLHQEFHGGAVYDSKAWFIRTPQYVGGTGYVSELWSFNGTALAFEESITGSEAPSGGFYAAASPNPYVFNSFLYYGWVRNSDNQIMLGRYNGSSWDHTHYPTGRTATTDIAISWLIEIGGNLWMATYGTDGFTMQQFFSAGTDTTSWTSYDFIGGSRFFPIS